MNIKEIAYKYNIDEYMFDYYVRANNLEYTPVKNRTGNVPDSLVEEYVHRFKTGPIRTEESIEAEKRRKAEAQKWMEEVQKKIEEANATKEIRRKNFMITNGYNFEGYVIKQYIGLTSGSIVIGTGFFSEFSASISDLWGTENNSFSEKMEKARRGAIEKLQNQALDMGANAIIGVDVDLTTLSNNMIGVIANGTAVIIEKIEEYRPKFTK